MSVSPRRARGLNSPLVRTLHEDLGDRLACLFQTGARGKLEDFGMIERVFDTDRFWFGRIRSGNRIRRRDGFGRLDGRHRCDQVRG